MKKILKNVDDFKEWEKNLPPEAGESLRDPEVREHLVSHLEILDRHYGRERDLKRDLGGYCAVLWGGRKEVLADRESLFKEHNLCGMDCEFEDTYILPDSRLKVCFQLYLCSSDYAVEMMMVFRDGD